MFADICIDISHKAVDRPFAYRIPQTLEGKVNVGDEVLVPFGAGNKMRHGYVIALSDKCNWDESKIKSVEAVCEDRQSASGRLIKTAVFIRREYGGTMINALKTVMPVKKVVRKSEHKLVCANVDENELKRLCTIAKSKHQFAKMRLLSELLETEKLDNSLLNKINVSASTVNSLEKIGAVKVESYYEYRNPFSFRERNDNIPELSNQQQTIVDDVTGDLKAGNNGTYLIHGITGSGKTEVYMRLIENVVNEGGQAVLLIPEISLTYQNLRRFYRRFGSKVSIIHSRLSDGEKSDQFERVRKGEVSVMIGPRSALFTPFENLKLIIIDEEHEPSYISEGVPAYHAVKVAEYMASLSGASVVLGSATPSLESYYRALNGEIKLYEMTKRLTGNTLPRVETVDLREELKAGNKSIFSRSLSDKMEKALERDEQIMLFINRRGMSGFVSCRSCGEAIKCPHCDVSLSEHKGGVLVCHYCGYETVKPDTCPNCSSKALAGFKAGTEQIEEMIKVRFPQALVLRMDADTTKKKEDYDLILSKFESHEADILLGTQMIVKGHDFKNVTLVGVLAADMSLNVDDYRAGERTFQLLTQAAGRAGRGDKPGDVVIQTYQPDNYAIVHAVSQDYKAFYEEEILYRKLMKYPPAANMIAILISGPDERRVTGLSTRISNDIDKTDLAGKFVRIGPAKARISKKNDLYRQIIYYKATDNDVCIAVKDYAERIVNLLPLDKESVRFDFNPVNSL